MHQVATLNAHAYVVHICSSPKKLRSTDALLIILSTHYEVFDLYEQY